MRRTVEHNSSGEREGQQRSGGDHSWAYSPAVLVRGLSACLLLAAVLLAWTALPANADGGAPNLAYIAGAGNGSNQLVVINIGAKSIAWRLTLGGHPHSVLLSTDARTAYVSEPAANRLAFVDTSGHTVSATLAVPAQPTAIALDLSSSPNALYVAEYGGNAIAEVNLDSRKVAATIPVGQQPSGLAVAASGSGIPNANDPEVFVANTGSNTVSVVGTHERRVLATIPVPGGPENITIPGVGGVAYVTTHSGTVVAISVAQRKVLGTVLQTPGDALGVMDYNAVTGQIYVPDATTNAVDVLAPVTSAPVYANGTTSTQFTVPHEPARVLKNFAGAAAVAITFEGAYGFIAERTTGQVAMLDAGTNAVLARLQVGGTPQSVITGANPPVLGPQLGLILGVIVLLIILSMPVYLFVSERRYRRKRETPGAQRDARASGDQSATKTADDR